MPPVPKRTRPSGDTSAPTRDELIRICGALASDKRLLVLDWLADPESHFPPQRDGDLVEDGVCSVFIAEKLGISQPTTSRHMKILLDAGLVRSKPQKGWTFYRLDSEGMARARQAVEARLGRSDSARPSAGSRTSSGSRT